MNLDFWDWIDLITDIKNNPNDFYMRIMKAHERGKLTVKQLKEYADLAEEILQSYWKSHENKIEHTHFINAEDD